MSGRGDRFEAFSLCVDAAGTKDAWHRVLYLASHPFEDVASHLTPGMQPS